MFDLERCNIIFFSVNILYETEQSVRNNKPVGIISSFQREINIINNMLRSDNKIESETAGQIITFLGKLHFVYKHYCLDISYFEYF